ncbi:MAG: hypothetical protein IT226_04590 [Flavobacteriales bacterium]|nr:hypothetical protein [Flavobacteriales bacterium]
MRIAPTPSGFLHEGNALAFLITAQLAKQNHARLRLRIDDLDAERERPAYVDDIFASLRWLGIVWTDGPRDRHDHERNWSQQHRITRYMDHLELLKEQGDLYACRCSRSTFQEHQLKGSRRCDCRARNLAFGSPDVVWRLHLPQDALVRMEQVFGEAIMLTPADLITDPVLRQRATEEGPGRPAYQIASLADDVDHGTTIIVRGNDLLPSTACQLYMADRLGLGSFKHVRFLHHPLITDPQGHKLSKSESALALKAMRGIEGAADGLHLRANTILGELAKAATQDHH